MHFVTLTCYRRVHSILYVHMIGGMEGEAEAVADIRSQCSHTHNVGHALLFALLCQKLVTPHGEEVRLCTPYHRLLSIRNGTVTYCDCDCRLCTCR